MLLPASSSFVTGVIKERARASTLPPRLSFFRPAALVGGREEGEMEGGGGRSPTLRSHCRNVRWLSLSAMKQVSAHAPCGTDVIDRMGGRGRDIKTRASEQGRRSRTLGCFYCQGWWQVGGWWWERRTPVRGGGRRRREGRPRWRCPSLRVCSFLCDEFSFGPVLSYGLERAHRKG